MLKLFNEWTGSQLKPFIVYTIFQSHPVTISTMVVEMFPSIQVYNLTYISDGWLVTLPCSIRTHYLYLFIQTNLS